METFMECQIEQEYRYEMKVMGGLVLIFIGLSCEWLLINGSSHTDIFGLVNKGLLTEQAHFWLMTCLMMYLVLQGVLYLIARINGFGRVCLTTEGLVFPGPVWRLGTTHVPYGAIVDLDFRTVFFDQVFDVKTDGKKHSFVSNNFRNKKEFEAFCHQLTQRAHVSLNHSIFKPETPPTNEPIGHRLYKISGIGVAAFFGGPVAGGLLIAKNYKQMGKLKEARQARWLSVLAMLTVVTLLWFIPEDWNLPNTSVSVPLVFLTVFIAQHLQQNDINMHMNAGGEFISNWKAFGFSLLVLLGVLCLLFTGIIAWEIFAH